MPWLLFDFRSVTQKLLEGFKFSTFRQKALVDSMSLAFIQFQAGFV
jgi:hypothetical protein